MMRALSWLTKRVLLPLTPFLVGALIRWVYVGRVQWSTFDVGELSFSMAMLSLLMLVSVGKLDDRTLSDLLCSLYTFLLVVFVAMFGCTTLFKTQLDSHFTSLVIQLRQSLQVGQSVPNSVVTLLSDPRDQELNVMLSRIFVFVVVLSVCVIITTVVFKQRYRLED